MNVQSEKVNADQAMRTAGVLMHITSLPTRYGIGDLGPAAHRWVDLLAGAKQRWWQMLPLGPAGDGNSPYQCFSVYAGNPALISPDGLFEDGLLSRAELSQLVLPAGRVNFTAVNRNKAAMLAMAWDRFQQQSNHGLRPAFRKFVTDESIWLDDFSLFMALRSSHPKLQWTHWPKPILHRKESALAEVRRDLAAPIARLQFGQFLFARQLQSLRKHARAARVGMIGDLPIFISPDSVDVWTDPGLFQLDSHFRPTAVAGVPPDLFSADGQRWGNPLYNWKAMAANQFRWWDNRLTAALRQADLVRIDHFRGFESYWRVPASSASAVNGKWVKAPGQELFEALRLRHPGLPLLAEDLGLITPAVEKLRDDFGLPGMRILQFGFDGNSSNIHLPHHFPQHCFTYTGTHDNDTTVGWFASLTKAGRKQLRDYVPGATSKKTVSWALIRSAWGSVANRAIAPLQDVLSLGSEGRMNIPGSSEHNWAWRLQDFRDCRHSLSLLAEITQVYDRAPGKT